MAEDPEEGATLAELEISFLSPFDPETESLEEYEVRLHQGVEMARPDCRDEAISRQCCLGEAQFQTAFSRFTTLCRTTPTAARPDGPDHVLRATGAGISKLMQMWGADPVAIYYRYKGAAEAYSEAGGTDSSGRAGEAAVASRERVPRDPCVVRTTGCGRTVGWYLRPRGFCAAAGLPFRRDGRGRGSTRRMHREVAAVSPTATKVRGRRATRPAPSTEQ